MRLTLFPSPLYVFIERFPAYPLAWQNQDMREGIRRHASERDCYIDWAHSTQDILQKHPPSLAGKGRKSWARQMFLFYYYIQQGVEEVLLYFRLFIQGRHGIYRQDFIYLISPPFSCSKRIAKPTFFPPSVIISYVPFLLAGMLTKKG